MDAWTTQVNVDADFIVLEEHNSELYELKNPQNLMFISNQVILKQLMSKPTYV